MSQRVSVLVSLGHQNLLGQQKKISYWVSFSLVLDSVRALESGFYWLRNLVFFYAAIGCHDTASSHLQRRFPMGQISSASRKHWAT